MLQLPCQYGLLQRSLRMLSRVYKYRMRVLTQMSREPVCFSGEVRTMSSKYGLFSPLSGLLVPPRLLLQLNPQSLPLFPRYPDLPYWTVHQQHHKIM